MKNFVKSFLMSTASNLREFADDQSGSILQMTGLSIIPLMLAAGVGIDMARINFTHQKLSSGLDAGALAAATMVGKTEAQMQTEAQAYLNRNFVNGDTVTILSSKLTNSTTSVVFEATARVPTTIMKLAGTDYVDVKLSSEVTKSGESVEVALLLDNTGSMSPSMSSLKTASKKFVEKVLAGASSPYYAKIAIVPYSMGVNVDTYAVSARGPINTGTSTTPGSESYTFRRASDQTDKTFNITTCVSERTGAQRYTDAPVSSNPVGRVYAGSNNPCLSSTLQPLTSTKSTLDSSIDAMAAGGSSAGQVGIAWGWYTLSPNFGLWSGSSVPASYTAEKLRKVVVLMTDGEYNSAYCNDVISGRPNYSGSGSASDHTNCPPTNDDFAGPPVPPEPVAPIQPVAPVSPGAAPVHPGTAPAVVVAPTPLPTSPKPTNSQKNAYNTALAKYNAYVTAKATYNAALAQYNIDKPIYDAAKAVYDAAKTKYDADLIAYNLAKGKYDADVVTYNAAVIAYDAAVANHNPSEKSSYKQSKALCAAMKAKGIEIYTIEFELNTGISERVDLVQSCATDADHRVTASNASQLEAAFTKIANSLNELRVSK
jgi:Flp pilus assembly protein TadG